MSTSRLDRRGPEPVQTELPPTLQPHAIQCAAPARSRRLSFLASCLVYASMAGSFSLASHLNPQLLSGTPSTTTSTEYDSTKAITIPLTPEPPPPPPPPVRDLVKVEGTRPSDWQAPVANNIVPDTIPQVPTVDHSRDSLYNDGMKIGDGKISVSGVKDGTGPVSQPASNSISPSVVDIEFNSVKVLHQVSPVYPRICQAVKLQGTVELLMTVDPRGVPSDIQTLSSTNGSFTESAVAAARQWRFVPATQNGQPVSSRFKLTLKFSLR